MVEDQKISLEETVKERTSELEESTALEGIKSVSEIHSSDT